MRFEYDSKKAASNENKHGVSFEEAISVFEDPLLLLLENSSGAEEDRFIAAGFSELSRFLLVVHCIREARNNEEIIRIISARQATKRERKQFEEIRE